AKSTLQQRMRYALPYPANTSVLNGVKKYWIAGAVEEALPSVSPMVMRPPSGRRHKLKVRGTDGFASRRRCMIAVSPQHELLAKASPMMPEMLPFCRESGCESKRARRIERRRNEVDLRWRKSRAPCPA